jgi:hypothetical protein
MRIPAGVLPMILIPISAVMVQNFSNEGMSVSPPDAGQRKLVVGALAVRS